MRRALVTSAVAALVISAASPALATGEACSTHFEQVPPAPAQPVWFVEVVECEVGTEPVSVPAPHPSPKPVLPIKVKPGKTSSSTRGTREAGSLSTPKRSGTSATGTRTGTARRTTQISGKAVSATASASGSSTVTGPSSSPTSSSKKLFTLPDLVKPSASPTKAALAAEKPVATGKTKLADTGHHSMRWAALASGIMFCGAGVLVVARRHRVTGG